MNLIIWIFSPIIYFVIYLLPVILCFLIPILIIAIFPKGRNFLKTLAIEIDKYNKNKK